MARVNTEVEKTDGAKTGWGCRTLAVKLRKLPISFAFSSRHYKEDTCTFVGLRVDSSQWNCFVKARVERHLSVEPDKRTLGNQKKHVLHRPPTFPEIQEQWVSWGFLNHSGYSNVCSRNQLLCPQLSWSSVMTVSRSLRSCLVDLS